MSKMIKLDVTQACFEGLRCSVCSGYLSCAPIRLLPAGDTTCGRCSPSNTDVLAYRVMVIENLLNNATFPCKYQQFGCTANVLFNHALEHEGQCGYFPFPCASLPFTACTWKGSASQVSAHFTAKHPDFVHEDAKVKLQMDQDKQGVLVVRRSNGSFIVKYMYDSKKSNFKYVIKLCIADIDDKVCKLQLTNDLDPDYPLNLKIKCGAYNNDLYDMKNAMNVDIKPLLSILNNAKNITVVFHATLPNQSKTTTANDVVFNFDILDSHKCTECKYYLVPPIFDYENRIICSDCAYQYRSCKPCSNIKLKTVLVQENFPCRWRDCDVIIKGDAFGRHQNECDFRMYRCSIRGCNVSFKRASAEVHMKSHACSYFSDSYIHRFTFLKEPIREFSVFTIVDYEIVVLNIKALRIGNSYMEKYTLDLKNFNRKSSDVVGIVSFQHEHCKCESKFRVNNCREIIVSELLECYRSNEIVTVTLTIQQAK